VHGLGVLHADPALGRVAAACGVRHRRPGGRPGTPAPAAAS
jgi:hypothetical protein